MRTSRLAVVLLALASACAGNIEAGESEVAVSNSALTWVDAQLTLDANATVEDPACVDGAGVIGLSGTLTSTALTTVVAMVSTDGGAEVEYPLVLPADFTPVGAQFQAPFDAEIAVANGMHSTVICFAVKRTRGVSTIRACLPAVESNLNCEPPPPPPEDMVPPTIVGSRTPEANAAGWNNGDVSVTFSCADDDSGVASCTGDATLTEEGAGQSVTGNASDNAGNTASASVDNINIDKTPPEIVASRSSSPNAEGWYNAPVTVSFACSDALSGVAFCSEPVVLSDEGAFQSVDGEAADLADNAASTSEGPISIDMTPPSVVFTGAREYNVSEVVNVDCEASDELSGLASASCPDVMGNAYELGAGEHALVGSATDNAGNSTLVNASYSVTVTAAGVCELATQFASASHYATHVCKAVKVIANCSHPLLAKLQAVVVVIWLHLSSGFSDAEADILASLIWSLVD